MKLGCEVNIYKVFGDDKYIKMREHGYSCGDFDMSQESSEYYTCSDEEFEAILLKEKLAAKKAGIEIHQVHGPWRWPADDSTEEIRAARMQKMKRSIRGTAVLGCKYWVIHPIMPYGTQDAGTENEQKTWDMNIEFMGELLKTAKECGVIICYENMPFTKFSISTPDAIKRFVDEMDDENFKICLDTGHVSVFPGLNPSDAVRFMGKDIKVLHVHDNDGKLDRHFMPYFGVINWEDFSRALHEIDFDGVLSLETTPSKRLPKDIYEEALCMLSHIAKRLAE